MSKPIREMTIKELDREIEEITKKLNSLMPLVKQAERHPFFDILVKDEPGSVKRPCEGR